MMDQALKRKDLYMLLGVAAILAPFLLFESVFQWYKAFNAEHGMLMSFVKFAILATLGELLGLRIRTGRYFYPGFGILPRAFVWGFLGLTIQMAFVIFSSGGPTFLEYCGMNGALNALTDTGFSGKKLVVAFFVSASMNVFYAPVMMTMHKITDAQIEKTAGSFIGLFHAFNMGALMAEINWRVQWDFVFKKTIPLFWIPAHTVTFLLPADQRVLFAALLSIILGVLLAMAAVRGRRAA